LLVIFIALKNETPNAQSQPLTPTPVDSKDNSQPHIKLSAQEKRIGEIIEVHGRGFPTGTTITAQLISSNQEEGLSQLSVNIGSIQTDVQGLFSLSILLQNYQDGRPLQTGPVILVAGTEGGVLKATAQLNLLVAADPKLMVSPSSGAVGSIINIKGIDFPPHTRLNIAIGKINSEAGGSYATPLTNGAGTFEVEIKLVPFSGQKLLPGGEIVLVAHSPDYNIKALTIFNVTAPSSLPPVTGQTPGKMPGALPSSGQGYLAGNRSAGNLPPLPNFLILAVLLILATTSFIGLRRINRAELKKNVHLEYPAPDRKTTANF
jgi:hypothetical protein